MFLAFYPPWPGHPQGNMWQLVIDLKSKLCSWSQVQVGARRGFLGCSHTDHQLADCQCPDPPLRNILTTTYRTDVVCVFQYDG